MELLFNSKKNTSSSDLIRISAATVSVSGNLAKRFTFHLREKNYGAFGLDDKGNLCFYYSGKSTNKFFKFYQPKESNNYFTFHVSKGNREIMKPYIGKYDVAEISVEDADKDIYRARLIKVKA